MKFLDTCTIYVCSGDGGAGCISFRREKRVPRGGPDGGDGGRGGHIWAEATDGLNTLIDLRYRPHIKARTGEGGKGARRTGASGQDVTVKLPVGVQIFDEDKTSLIADLDEQGKRIRLAEGGSGGWGNTRFTTSVNRAPRRANPGLPGQERTIWLQLKLIADAGLVGLPNAGKSTFLAAVSAARPKIADYPFTTLVPNLGTVTLGPGQAMVIADIPGLIEGAAEGVGLGTDFLAHIERCGALLHLVDATEPEPIRNWQTVRDALAGYGHGLDRKAEVLVLNKTDAVDAHTVENLERALSEAASVPVMSMSGVSGAGVPAVIRTLAATAGIA